MNHYRTKDIYEAASLISSNAKFLRLEPQNNFYWFIFEDLDTCRKTSELYWSNNLIVNAKHLTDAIRSLKDQIFSRKD